MVVLQSMIRAGSWTQFRSFSKSFHGHLERFNSESLGSKVSKQNLKDVVKQNVHNPGPSKPPLPVDVIPIRPSKDLWKALGFTVAVGVGSFTVAYISELDQIRNRVKNTCAKDNLAPVKNPDRQKITWETLTHIEKATIFLVGANALIYLVWKVKPLKPFMLRYFSCSFVPSRSLCPPMLLRVFSQSCFGHFGANMFLFYFFANLTIDQFFGPGHFWAFFSTAAVVSSLSSLCFQAAIRSPMRAMGAYAPTLALFGYYLMQNPNQLLRSDPFLGFDSSAKNLFYGFILYELVFLALFRKSNRIFDHAGHLGGFCFGAFYALIGEQFERNLFEGGVMDMHMKKARAS